MITKHHRKTKLARTILSTNHSSNKKNDSYKEDKNKKLQEHIKKY